MSYIDAPKPPASASVFARAAWFLDDYASLWIDVGHDEPDDLERIAEKQELARRLRELDGQWEAKQEAGTTASAAAIVADMLKDWRLPGAVYWHPVKRRWRVVGEGYQPRPPEICVGVYAPNVHPSMLLEDFQAAEQEEPASWMGETV